MVTAVVGIFQRLPSPCDLNCTPPGCHRTVTPQLLKSQPSSPCRSKWTWCTWHRNRLQIYDIPLLLVCVYGHAKRECKSLADHNATQRGSARGPPVYGHQDSQVSSSFAVVRLRQLPRLYEVAPLSNPIKT